MNGAILDEAFKRGCVGAVVVFIATLASTLLIDTITIRETIGLALTPAIGYFATRTGYETLIDTRRASRGEMLPSDVPVVSDAVRVLENAPNPPGQPVLSEEPK